jgi:uncharacterized protein (DUF1697 family)
MTNIHIVLLRAINAGGVNSLPMKDFVQILEHMGLGSVRTYIQTGNAVFHANEVDAIGLPEKIKGEIGTRHGFVPKLFCLRWMRWEARLHRIPTLKPLQIPDQFT